MKSIYVFSLLLFLGLSMLPKTYDVRVQPSIASYADYSVMYEPVCEGYVWAQQLSQVFSNIASVKQEQKIKLSGQQIIECISSTTDLCKETTIENIEAGIKLLQTSGLTNSFCYKNNYLESPSSVCKRKCYDDEPFPLVLRAIIKEEDDKDELLRSIGNGDSTGFVILKIYDGMNYYSSEHPTHFKAEGSFFGYTIAQITGWKDNGSQVMVRLGGNGWGYKGYGYVNADDKDVIVRKYSVSLLKSIADE